MELNVHKFWCFALLCLNCLEMYVTSSPTDTLIIRHGRSRVRHSSEKDHIRWGLKAFDLEFNSTVYEFDNDTVEANDNQSFYGDNGSDSFYVSSSGERIGSSSLSPPEYQNNPTKDKDEEVDKATVLLPKSKLGKKQIMANIRKTVEKGVEYLKSHAHFHKDNIEYDSEMPAMTENNFNSKDVNGNPLKSDNNNVLLSPLIDDITNTSTSITKTKENHVQSDDGEAHLRQLNITPSSSHPMKKFLFNSSTSNTKSTNNSSDEQSDSVPHVSDSINKHIKSLLKHEQIKSKKSEMHIRDNKNNEMEMGIEEKIDKNTEKPLLYDEKAFSDSADYESESMPSGLYSENNEQANTEDDSQIGNFDLNENNEFSNVIRRFDEYVDLEGLDETSKKNRMNLKQGRDLLTKFLQIVETQHLLGSNCTAGTALNLGEGVVDRYAHDRFRVEAEIAVNRANMLTSGPKKFQ
ncbi:hypothetical protein Bhyg_06229 [Pseudolycoriella hygida]|uniref:Uncharacterized protein n=1 Tax=Pseudolycoriella hygida TaxID=35572 RepID=A0A9Q0S278_9DIPT|nr:hypothetical protein Bhyg_06229 [Pseudolycoriella hygida]